MIVCFYASIDTVVSDGKIRTNNKKKGIIRSKE